MTPTDKKSMAYKVGYYGVPLLFWTGVSYIVIHFLFKYW